MKRILTFILCAALTLFFCLPAAAGAAHWATDSDSFSPVGDVPLTWLPEGAVLTLDGDLSDWSFCPVTEITPNNLTVVSPNEVDEKPTLPEDFAIRARFAVDTEGLYVAFDITDHQVIRAPEQGKKPVNGNTYGDAVLFGFDFNGIIRRLDEWVGVLCHPTCIVYMITMAEDGVPFGVFRVESDNDGLLTPEDTEGLQGATALTDEGWCTEFFLSWKRIYADAEWKGYYHEDPSRAWNEDSPLFFGADVFYANHDESTDKVDWHARTDRGLGGVPTYDARCDHSGITLTLDYVPDRPLNCTGIRSGQPETVETDTETELEALPVTEAPVTAAPDAQAPDAAPDGTIPEAELVTGAPEWAEDIAASAGDEAPAGAGCEALSASAVLVLCLAAAAGAFMRKRE